MTRSSIFHIPSNLCKKFMYKINIKYQSIVFYLWYNYIFLIVNLQSSKVGKRYYIYKLALEQKFLVVIVINFSIYNNENEDIV